ncbi:hypothetical protein QQX13_00190 [Demequina sp. SYSU T00068]|uniref:hypothetical protein n=1 Tax=Demequina lignilytica TaxID=3051663 RepID=UPI0026032587|nr:hypothetical protein [Demequina sp. SYSU T00068]MDN4489242.1 hypothetical protein [Demequina sp. SYSU T00068]
MNQHPMNGVRRRLLKAWASVAAHLSGAHTEAKSPDLDESPFAPPWDDHDCAFPDSLKHVCVPHGGTCPGCDHYLYECQDVSSVDFYGQRSVGWHSDCALHVTVLAPGDV